MVRLNADAGDVGLTHNRRPTGIKITFIVLQKLKDHLRTVVIKVLSSRVVASPSERGQHSLCRKFRTRILEPYRTQCNLHLLIPSSDKF